MADKNICTLKKIITNFIDWQNNYNKEVAKILFNLLDPPIENIVIGYINTTISNCPDNSGYLITTDYLCFKIHERFDYRTFDSGVYIWHEYRLSYSNKYGLNPKDSDLIFLELKRDNPSSDHIKFRKDHLSFPISELKYYCQTLDDPRYIVRVQDSEKDKGSLLNKYSYLYKDIIKNDYYYYSSYANHSFIHICDFIIFKDLDAVKEFALEVRYSTSILKQIFLLSCNMTNLYDITTLKKNSEMSQQFNIDSFILPRARYIPHATFCNEFGLV